MQTTLATFVSVLFLQQDILFMYIYYFFIIQCRKQGRYIQTQATGHRDTRIRSIL